MTTLNCLGILGQVTFGIGMIALPMAILLRGNWKWWLLEALCIIFFFLSSMIAID